MRRLTAADLKAYEPPPDTITVGAILVAAEAVATGTATPRQQEVHASSEAIRHRRHAARLAAAVHGRALTDRGWREDAEALRREDPELYRRAQHLPSDAIYAPRAELRAVVGLAGQHGRAPASTATRRRGSRRTSSSSRSSGVDPGDDDPEPARVCGGCDKPLIGYAPQARFHGDSCRMRARRRALRPARPTWPEAEIVAAAMAIEPLPVLAALMQEPPGGPVAHRRELGRDWRTGPGSGHRAPIRYDQMAVVV